MKKYTKITFMTVFGAPVYIHWSALAAIAFITVLSFKTPITAIIFMASYFGIIFAHEFGHALVAHKLGSAVIRIDIGFIHGWCHHEQAYDDKHDSLIAWGGVAIQIAIALPVLLLAQIPVIKEINLFAPVVIFLGYINLLLALFNLAPSRLLDGGVAWKIIPILIRERKAKQTVKKLVKSKFKVVK